MLALSFLNNVKENWENLARNLSCPFLVYLQCVFVSFQNRQISGQRELGLCFEFLGSSLFMSPWLFLYSNRGFCMQYMRLNRGQILLQSRVLNRHQPSLPLHCSSRISCQVVPLLQRSDYALQQSHLSTGLCRAELWSVLSRQKHRLAGTASLGLGCTAEIQVLCLGKASAETFSGLLSHKRESNS